MKTNGAFTGKNEVLHEIDVEISVENGIAETKKNRFNYGGKKYISTVKRSFKSYTTT